MRKITEAKQTRPVAILSPSLKIDSLQPALAALTLSVEPEGLFRSELRTQSLSCSSGNFYLSFVSTKLGDITILKNLTRPKMTRAHSLKICHPDAVRSVFAPGSMKQPIALLEIWKFTFGQRFHLRQVVSSCEIQCLSISAC